MPLYYVGDHHTGCLTLSFEKLSHKTFGCLGITAALHQHIENKAILINGPPQPVLFAASVLWAPVPSAGGSERTFKEACIAGVLPVSVPISKRGKSDL